MAEHTGGTSIDMADPAPERERVERVIAFVDLAGFTALTEAHGDGEAADTQQAFADALREAVGDTVECVKHLGDGALLASADGTQMLRSLTELVRTWSAQPHAPLARIGVHAGAALKVHTLHGLDYLGSTVNVAARICELAAGGQLIYSDRLDREVAAAGLASVALGRRSLRGISRTFGLGLVELTRAADVPLDPVCRMPVPQGTGAGALEYEGTTWSFCSLRCAGAFAGSPSSYV